MELFVTIALIGAAMALIVYLVWLEKRPVELGKPRLVPLTPVLFLCILVLIMALAHVISLLSGTPYMGRMGRF